VSVWVRACARAFVCLYGGARHLIYLSILITRQHFYHLSPLTIQVAVNFRNVILNPSVSEIRKFSNSSQSPTVCNSCYSFTYLERTEAQVLAVCLAYNKLLLKSWLLIVRQCCDANAILYWIQAEPSWCSQCFILYYRRQYAIDLQAGVRNAFGSDQEHNKTWSCFTVTISLTDLGFRNIDEVRGNLTAIHLSEWLINSPVDYC